MPEPSVAYNVLPWRKLKKQRYLACNPVTSKVCPFDYIKWNSRRVAKQPGNSCSIPEVPKDTLLPVLGNCQLVLIKGSWAVSRFPFKTFPECLYTFVSTGLADLMYWMYIMTDKRLGHGYPLFNNVLIRCTSTKLIKDPDKMILRHAGSICQVLDLNDRIDILFDELNNLINSLF